MNEEILSIKENATIFLDELKSDKIERYANCEEDNEARIEFTIYGDRTISFYTDNEFFVLSENDLKNLIKISDYLSYYKELNGKKEDKK